LGDDSGLLVDALNGKPGIYSARYAGTDADDKANNHKLLNALRGVPRPERSAHFYCATVFVRHAEDPAPLISTGQWPGRIMEQPRGEGGFGYDPLFWVPACECTSAELTPEVKNSISHRGQALAALTAQMKDEFRN
jgi:XTP/dITP diphosphohydrolase